MKKLVVLLLLALMVFCFVSCDIDDVDDGPFAGTVYIRRLDNKALLGQTNGMLSGYTKWSQMLTTDLAFSRFDIQGKGTYDSFVINGDGVKISGESLPPALTVYDAQGNPITDKESPILKNVYVIIN